MMLYSFTENFIKYFERQKVIMTIKVNIFTHPSWAHIYVCVYMLSRLWVKKAYYDWAKLTSKHKQKLAILCDEIVQE